MRRFAVILIVVFCACRTSPNSSSSSPPIVDLDAGADDAAKTCAHLRELGCSTGAPPCEDVLRRIEMTHLTTIDYACVERANSASDVRACGVSCP